MLYFLINNQRIYSMKTLDCFWILVFNDYWNNYFKRLFKRLFKLIRLKIFIIVIIGLDLFYAMKSTGLLDPCLMQKEKVLEKYGNFVHHASTIQAIDFVIENHGLELLERKNKLGFTALTQRINDNKPELVVRRKIVE